MGGIANPRYGDIDLDLGIRLASIDAADDGPVCSISLLKHRARADYADGRPTDLTGREADMRFEQFRLEHGHQVVLTGDVTNMLTPTEPRWDRFRVVAHESRSAFIQQQLEPAFQDALQHKEAGVEHSLVLIGTAMELPAFSTSADVQDDRCVFVHLSGGLPTGAAEAFNDVAIPIALAAGVRPAGWFEIEGSIIGDGSTWEDVHFDYHPSATTWELLWADERWQEQALSVYRASAWTCSMLLRPDTDRFSTLV